MWRMMLCLVVALTGSLAMAQQPPAREGETKSVVLRQVTTRTIASQRNEAKVAGHDACTTRIQHVVTSEAQALRFVYAASAGIGYQLKASAEIGGVNYPLTFEGQTTVTVGPKRYVVSDPLDVVVKKGEVIYSRTYLVNSDEKMIGNWQRAMVLSADRGEWHGEGDLTASGEAQSLTYNDNTRGPIHILGEALEPGKAMAFNGDSIVSFGPEPWTIQLADRIGAAWSHATTGGDSILYQKDRRVACWPMGLGGFTHFICALGANDMARGEQIFSKYVEHWTWASAQGVKVFQTTVLPMATSTDRFATLENQTPRPEFAELRVRFNDWLRDGAPLVDGAPAVGTTNPNAVRIGQVGHPLAGYIETADAVESSRNSGKWRVDQGSIGGDGIHPTAKAQALIAASIPASLFD